MQTLSKLETTQFLEAFLKGLLDVGLLEPLQDLGKSQSPKIKAAAESLQSALVDGLTPQTAVGLMSPRFHPMVEALIVYGFGQSNIDFILSDIIKAYKTFDDGENLNKALGDLLERYSPLTTEVICLDCWSNEIQKILARANAEQSAQVILSSENGHLVQKYISAKLVTISEPAIPAVYETLRKVFSDLTKPSVENSLGLDMKCLSKDRYQINLKSRSLIVSFAD